MDSTTPKNFSPQSRRELPVLNRLNRLRIRIKRIGLASAILQWLMVLLILIFVTGVLEAILWMKPVWRQALLALALSNLIILFVRWIGLRVFELFFRPHQPDDETLSQKVGLSFPEIRDRLLNALQVVRQIEKEGARTSSELAIASLDRIDHETSNYNFETVADLSPLKKQLKWFGALLLPTVMIFLFFAPIQNGLNRILHPTQVFKRPAPYQLILLPGNQRILSGEPVTITVQHEGDRTPERVELFIQETDAPQRSVELMQPFEHTIESVKQGFTYFAKAGRIQSEVCSITVFQLPLIRSIQVRLTPPAYTGESPLQLEDNAGEIESAYGTRADIRIQSTHALDRAEFKFSKRASIPMQIKGQEGSGSFTVSQPDTYWIEIADVSGQTNPKPIRYPIRPIRDGLPTARILYPAEDTDLEKEMQLNLQLGAEDDYGISNMQLGYWMHVNELSAGLAPDTLYEPIPFRQAQSTRVTINWTWDLREMGLFPEDRVSYFLEVKDNDPFFGPKRGRSRIYTVRFPSMMEIYDKVTEKQDDQIESLEEILKESVEMREKLEQLSDEMKAGKETGWETRQDLMSQSEKLQEMQETVEELEQQLDEMIEQLENNDLIQQETLDKYLELQQMYQEMASPEMQEAMQQLQDAMSQVPEEALRREAEKLNLTQESFLRSIERTLNLLKRLQVEQKLDEMVRRMEEMTEQQEAINEELKNNPSSDSGLDQEQQALKKDMDAFQDAMDDLSSRMQELPNMPMDQMDSVQQQMDDAQLQAQMDQMTQMMQSGQMQQAGQQGQKTAASMQSMTDALKEMQKQMSQDQKEKIARQMQQASHQLLSLSQQQEGLQQQMQAGTQSSGQSAETQAGLQAGLRQVIQNMYQLSQETFFVTPEMGRALGQAQAQMQQAANGMKEPGQPGVSESQGGAMGAMNQAAASLQQSLEQLGQGQSGTGGEAMMSGLNQISMAQMALNRKLMDMLGQGRMSLGQQAAMQRLAAEQRAVQQALENLLREQGNQAGMAGRVGDLAREMEKTIREIQQQQVSPQTLQRQERILSRLLDAQQSLQKRDWSRKRQAQSGRDVRRQSPVEAQAGTDAWKQEIRDRLLHLNQEGYTRDYEALIRAYYQSLLKE
ncbi:hypothetical protein HQ585_09670 [candidate division KSB1 bacterium]|nr:hypothetical protein [candidate division KSB1 bacterium]